MAGKDDYCPCCLGWLPIALRAQRFCGDCERHATWCIEMASQRTRWDAFAQRWRVVAAIPAVWNTDKARPVRRAARSGEGSA